MRAVQPKKAKGASTITVIVIVVLIIAVVDGIVFVMNQYLGMNTLGRYSSFSEQCNTVDNSLWSTFWTNGLPIASGGYWNFTISVGTAAIKQANYANMTGYGLYTIRMKVPYPPQSGVNWFVFLYGNWGDYNPNQMELDFAEVYGSMPANTGYSITFWTNGTQVEKEGIGYWFINTTAKGISYDDGNFHTYVYNYTPTDLTASIDGVKIFDWQTDCINKTDQGMPIPPMRFMIGMDANGSQASSASMLIDFITYDALNVPST